MRFDKVFAFLNFPAPTLAYVTYQDIRAVGNFKEQTVIAVKAPPQTRLEVPDRAEVRRETLGGGQGRMALDSSGESAWHCQPQLHWSILDLGTSLVWQRFFSLYSLFRGYCARALCPHRSQVRASKNTYFQADRALTGTRGKMTWLLFSAEGGTWCPACSRTFSTTELYLYPWLFETGPLCGSGWC